MATLGEQSGRDTYFSKPGKTPAKTWLHYKIPKLSLSQCLMFIDASQKPHTENGLNAFSKGWLKYTYRYKKPLLMSIIFSILWLNGSLDTGNFGSRLLYFELDIPHTFPRSAVTASWPLPLAIHSQARNFPFVKYPIRQLCSLVASSSTPPPGREMPEVLWTSAETIPPCSASVFSGELWHQPTAYSATYQFLQAAFTPPQTSPIHACFCFFLLRLWENKFLVFNLAWYLTSFSSITAALPSGKHTTPVLCRLPPTAYLFNPEFW